MPITTNYANGQTLISYGLSPDALLTVFQQLLVQMLGISSSDPLAYSKVRIDWPTQGAPTFGIGDDIAFLRAVEIDDDYGHIRDQDYADNDAVSLVKHVRYTRIWEVTFTLYGPNAFDRARLIKDGLLNVDFVENTLNASSLYFVADPPNITYTPELFSGEWWKRADFSARFYEAVAAELIVPAMASVEVIVSTPDGVQADVTITKP